ncbi:hypothetical protein HIM_04480 [Hirsutella minnesotensis 3608]|uniref:Uncharacterized protein n=1 Tax=Hirsutella minnesotensis 3608 TaxID=1043627 RepID=A0A0F8A5W2_9HYPO|nr:hypothetical protein HIM_04480 [Hirsutella minnesotensis 3608]
MKSRIATAVLCGIAGLVLSAPTDGPRLGERSLSTMVESMMNQDSDMGLEQRDMLHEQHKQLVNDIAMMYELEGSTMMGEGEDLGDLSNISHIDMAEAGEAEENMHDESTGMLRRADEQATQIQEDGPEPRRGYPATGYVPIRTKPGIIGILGFAERDT